MSATGDLYPDVIIGGSPYWAAVIFDSDPGHNLEDATWARIRLPGRVACSQAWLESIAPQYTGGGGIEVDFATDKATVIHLGCSRGAPEDGFESRRAQIVDAAASIVSQLNEAATLTGLWEGFAPPSPAP